METDSVFVQVCKSASFGHYFFHLAVSLIREKNTHLSTFPGTHWLCVFVCEFASLWRVSVGHIGLVFS